MVTLNNQCRHLSRQRGAALIMLLVGVSLLGLMAGLAGSSWQTVVQRAKEADLLWKGNQIRRAIGRYYNTSHGGGAAPKFFPSNLDALLKDPRFLETRRYLRKLYPDPMTDEAWVIIKGEAGRVIGVRSTARKKPYKQDNFREVNSDFAGKEHYSDWKFIYKTSSTKQQPANPHAQGAPQLPQ